MTMTDTATASFDRPERRRAFGSSGPVVRPATATFDVARFRAAVGPGFQPSAVSEGVAQMTLRRR